MVFTTAGDAAGSRALAGDRAALDAGLGKERRLRVDENTKFGQRDAHRRVGEAQPEAWGFDCGGQADQTAPTDARRLSDFGPRALLPGVHGTGVDALSKLVSLAQPENVASDAAAEVDHQFRRVHKIVGRPVGVEISIDEIRCAEKRALPADIGRPEFRTCASP
jgi:hypothetical protein